MASVVSFRCKTASIWRKISALDEGSDKTPTNVTSESCAIICQQILKL